MTKTAPDDVAAAPVLTTENATYAIGDSVLVREVSIAIAAGGVTALMGPNGAGKTTLLRLLAGDLTSTSGHVSLAGRVVSQISKHDLARQRAVLPQQSALAFSLLVEEVVAMGRGPFGEGAAACAKAVHRAMAETGIVHLTGRDYLTLSGGERQRVHLARVWAQIDGMEPNAPPVLFLDEPTNNLDLRHREQILDAATTLARQGVAVVAVLHDVNEALDHADQIVLMQRGRCLEHGPAEDLLCPDILEPCFGVRLREFVGSDGRRRLWT